MSKKKGLLIIAAVIGIGAMIYFFVINRSTEIEVNSMEVTEGSIEQRLDITGKVISEDIQEIVVPAGTEVLQVMIEEGEDVIKGDVLAVLDPSQLETSLAKQEINLEQVEADLRVAGGSADRQILQNNLQKAQESLSTLQRDYEVSKGKLEDIKILYENGAISLTEYENQENALKSLESSVKTAALNVEDAKLRYSDLGSSTSSTTGSLERQRRSILLDIEQLKEQIADTKIIADLDGTVVSLEIKANRTVGTDSKIVVQDTEKFLFEAFVTQEDAVSIERSQNASIKVTGIEGEYSGTVAEIGSKAETDPSSGSSSPKVKITIQLSAVDERIVSGYDADAEVITGSVDNVLLVNNEAIREDGEAGAYVYIIENGIAVKTSVQRGITDRYLTEIVDGLELGDIVVLNPPEELQDGSAVITVE
ncbi:efflux RND transporter periplasmic adaptor subunit [Gudongella sp. DL1XJH-153]|uniref:efflux RND transporter periplasmic adaptor subunit n=1 Tax=Gudongella sp. DL1XJH-153 TaxID=3409804 RepID=UPI003BB53248